MTSLRGLSSGGVGLRRVHHAWAFAQEAVTIPVDGVQILGSDPKSVGGDSVEEPIEHRHRPELLVSLGDSMRVRLHVAGRGLEPRSADYEPAEIAGPPARTIIVPEGSDTMLNRVRRAP